MKNLWRAIRLILEIAIACIIFFFIATKTPLFDRAIPWRNTTTSVNQTWSTDTILSGNNTISTSKNTSGTVWTTLSSWTSSEAQFWNTVPSQHVIEQPVQEWIACRSPRWTSVQNNETIIAYKTTIANSENVCLSQTRTCNNGTLWWSYEYEYCNYEINGTITQHDGTKIETIAWASNSEQQRVNLNNYIKKKESIPDRYIQPTIVRDNSTPTLSDVKWQPMKNSTITIKPINSTDRLDQITIRDSIVSTYYNWCATPRWERVQHGNFIYAYMTSSSSIKQQCISEKRACVSGKLSGSFQYKSCEITDDPIGVVRNYNGDIVQRWLTPLYGNTTSQNHISINNTTGCITPRWQTIPHTSTIVAYRLPTSTDNSLCDKEVRSCKNGVLHGSYTYQTCMELPQNTKKRRRDWWNNWWN